MHYFMISISFLFLLISCGTNHAPLSTQLATTQYPTSINPAPQVPPVVPTVLPPVVQTPQGVANLQFQDPSPWQISNIPTSGSIDNAFVLTNLGSGVASGITIQLGTGTYFSITGSTCSGPGGILAPMGNCSVAVRFTPQAGSSAPMTDAILVTYQSGQGPVRIQKNLSASGSGSALLSVTGNIPLSFVNVQVGTTTPATACIQVTNTGTTNTTNFAARIGAPFTFTGAPACGNAPLCSPSMVLPPAGACGLPIAFVPTVFGVVSAPLELAYFDGTKPGNVQALVAGSGAPYFEVYQGAIRVAGGTYLPSCDAYIKSTLYSGQGSGSYWLLPQGAATAAPFQAYCQMDIANRIGWTLCSALGDRKLGATEAGGFNYLSSIWNTNGSVFMSTLNQVQSYGNFCAALPMSQLYSEVRSSVGTTRFVTGVFNLGLATTATNPFTLGQDTLITSPSTATLGLISRSSYASKFYGGSACAATSNSYTQGSDVCVSDGHGNWQLLMGNINSAGNAGGPGDWMCQENFQCGTGSDIILFYAR